MTVVPVWKTRYCKKSYSWKICTYWITTELLSIQVSKGDSQGSFKKNGLGTETGMGSRIWSSRWITDSLRIIALEKVGD